MTPEIRLQLATDRMRDLQQEREVDRLAALVSTARGVRPPAPRRGPLAARLRRLTGIA